MNDNISEYTLGRLNGLKLYADALYDLGILNNDDWTKLVGWIMQIDAEYRDGKYPRCRKEVLV